MFLLPGLGGHNVLLQRLHNEMERRLSLLFVVPRLDC